MDLEALYTQVDEKISSLDLNGVWPGFKPLKFALYDDEKCFFDGRYIEKADEFCANTSIEYHGEQIAIWMVRERMDIHSGFVIQSYRIGDQNGVISGPGFSTKPRTRPSSEVSTRPYSPGVRHLRRRRVASAPLIRCFSQAARRS